MKSDSESASRNAGILGHGAILAYLRRWAAADRLPHALLFSGPEGIGKRTVALALAGELVTHGDRDDMRRFDRGVHDRLVLYEDFDAPLAVRRGDLLEGELDEDGLLEAYEILVREEWIEGVARRRGRGVIDLLLRNADRLTGRGGVPLANVLERELGSLERSKGGSPETIAIARRLFSLGTSRVPYRQNLGIELINGRGDGGLYRTIQALLSRASSGGWRVAVIDDAHKMTEVAQNAFLKTLEEPPPRTLIVIVTPEPAALLPTIVSRCARVLFDSISSPDLGRFLVNEQGVGERAAALVATLADGSVRRALELSDLDLSERRSFLEGFLPEIARGDLREALSRVGGRLASVKGNRGEERAEARLFLELLTLSLRDLILVRHATGSPCLSGLEKPHLAELAARLPVESWERLFDRAEEALADVHANVEPRLAVEALFAEALPASR